MNYKEACSTAVGGIGLVFGVIGLIGYFKAKKLNAKLDNVTKAIDDISDDVDLTVPEDVVDVAMKRAADKECSKIAAKASEDISSEIRRRVNDAVRAKYANIESELKAKLEEKISLTTLDNIEKLVARDILERLPYSFGFSETNESEIASVIRTCASSGMDWYAISRIIDSMKKKGE